MLRVQTILYNERLWMPTRTYFQYGSTRVNTLPVTLPVSVAQEQFKPFVIAEEPLVHTKSRSLSSVSVESFKEYLESLKEPVESQEERNETQDETAVPIPLIQEHDETQQALAQENTEIESLVVEEYVSDTMTMSAQTELIPEHRNIESIVMEEQDEHVEEEFIVASEEEIEIMTEEPAVLETAPMTTVTMNISESQSTAGMESEKAPLTVDTYISDSQETSEEEGGIEASPVLGATSILSSASSFSPVTPTSIESPLETQMKSTKGSILRRETTKLNHKRRSLTNKLKNVLGHSNKRNSM